MRKTCILITVLTVSVGGSLFAQTTGPATPGVQKFTPTSAKEMVDLFTGNLNYNIPLFTLDSGYPLNLSYTSAQGMTDEAGPTGLGWSLNTGQVKRLVRGLPDDFSGEKVRRKLFQQSELNIGIGLGLDAELFGHTVKAGVTDGVTFSNMHGPLVAFNLNVSNAQVGDAYLSGGLGIGVSNQDGASITPNLGLRFRDYTVGVSTKINGMEGLKYVNLSGGKSFLQFSDFPLVSASTPFTPMIDFPAKTTAFSFSYRVGGEIWGLSGGPKMFGNYSLQSNPVNEIDAKAYGYLYLQNRADRSALLDIGTEKEGPVFAEDNNMPIGYLAEDIYSVAAQGLSGTFRPFRTDIVTGHRPSYQTGDVGGSLGGESHGGAWSQLGVDVSANFTTSYSGAWQDDPVDRALGQFPSADPPVYFKSVGETNRFRNQGLFDQLGGTKAVNFPIGESTLVNRLAAPATVGVGAGTGKQAENVNTDFRWLTAEEATRAHMNLSSFTGHDTARKEQVLPRYNDAAGNRKGHHISAIIVTKPNGSRYEFGIAAYNYVQREVTFSVAGKTGGNIFKRFTSFAPGDNSGHNGEGRPHYYSTTETPAYAYAYLLTAVYSADYVDVTGDGPSLDDLGTYTKFNYTLAGKPFKWRTPFQNASYIAGNLSDKGDDMAGYVYGEKETWTLNSIETKNSVLEVYTSPRADANSVAGETGGMDISLELSKIDSMKLYARAGYLSGRHEPTKSVFFNYDYSLAKGVPANKYTATVAGHPDSTGKLTLTGLAFTYGHSLKGKRSSYRFSYNQDPNFKYDESQVDRWGTTKEFPQSNLETAARFPYSEQDRGKAGRAASMWQLKEVALPTGATVKISYEAKDYAYVQDKPVMRMFKIAGFSKSGAAVNDASPVLYDNGGVGAANYLVVDVGASGGGIDLAKYLGGQQQLYLNCILKIGKHNSDSPGFEEVSGFFNIDPAGSHVIPGTTLVKIKLIANSGYQPVARVLWQKIRKTLTQVIDQPFLDPDGDALANIMGVVGQTPAQLLSVFAYFDFEHKMAADQHGQEMSGQAGSFVRLYDPSGHKLGGGSRVRSITVADNWDQMTGGSAAPAEYGQQYSYLSGANPGSSSSGVAAYEPVGNEENPFIVPAGKYSSTEDVLAPELYYYRTEPYGESFYPAPSVGYSRVEVTDIPGPGVTLHATGKEVYEFYTAKDFPTVVDRTVKQSITANPGFGPIGIQGQRYTASQGFAIELNDMHGKLRSHKFFAGGNPAVTVSGIEYVYRVKDNKLDNMVPTIDPSSGLVSMNQVGLDFDFFIHTSETSSLNRTPRMAFNLDVIPVVFGVPLPVPSFFPGYNEVLQQYKGVTTTKVIYRAGLLDKIIAYADDRPVTKRNLLYDEVSGEPVVTAEQNEFNKDRYTTRLPVHWFYPQMGPGPASAGKVFQNVVSVNTAFFNAGDEVLLAGGRDSRGWVYADDSGSKSLIDSWGRPLPLPAATLKITRPGNRNMQSLAAGEITTLDNPLPATAGKLLFNRVVAASATSYGQNWQTYYGVHPPIRLDSCKCNEPHRAVAVDSLVYDRNGTITRLVFPPGNPGNWVVNFDTGDPAVIHMRPQVADHASDCEVLIRLEKRLRPVSGGYGSLVFGSVAPVLTAGFCTNTSSGTGTYQVFRNGSVIDSGSFQVTNECTTLTSCQVLSSVVTDLSSCVVGSGQVINPYLQGVRGNWREVSTLHYLTERQYSALRVDSQGVYRAFAPYRYSPASANFFALPAATSNWQAVITRQVYDPHGELLQEANEIGLPEGHQVGYGYGLVTATATNAGYGEIAFDGFEDYGWLKQVGSSLSQCNLPEYFKFEVNGIGSGITDSDSHTGRHSMLVKSGSVVSLQRDIAIRSAATIAAGTPFRLATKDMVSAFSPRPGTVYALALWLKEVRQPGKLDESSGLVRVSFLDGAGNAVVAPSEFRAKGIIVDDWQMLSEKVTIPAGATKIRLELVVTGEMLVDDIRLQPSRSEMKTYVYDEVGQRLRAELDGQNLATFYEYDAEGRLERVKKETGHGIVTLQETRVGIPKN